MESRKGYVFASLILGVGLVAAGFFISQTLLKAKKFDRYVSVKGLSEREVMADIAIWPFEVTVVSNDLGILQDDLKKQARIIRSFLDKHGFTEEEMTFGSPNIQDTKANMYGGGSAASPYRYIAKTDVTIRTSDIDKLQKAASEVPELIGEGIIVGSKGYWQQIEYIYTKLNEIKPAMIEEATINAREAAEKFARDSGSKVGKIKSAHQGFFSIQNRDINTAHIKKVRVVSTIEFYLED
jgi:hypothetical protein